MLLLDLPTEILVIVYENLPATRTLYNLRGICSFARDVFANHALKNS